MGLGFGHFSAFVEFGDGLETVAHSKARLLTELPIIVHVRAALTTKRGWSAGPGTLALTGVVHLPALSAEFLFRKGPERNPPPDPVHRATAAIVTAGHAISIPPQRLPFTPRPESELSVRVSDPARQPPWAEHLVGRCSGLPLAFDRHLPVRGTLSAVLTPEEFADGRRTRVEIGGELRFERGLIGRFNLRDVGDKPTPPTESDAGEAVLLPAGTAVPIGRHTVWGLAGPNPWISLRIVAGGTPLGEEHQLGRSVRMH